MSTQFDLTNQKVKDTYRRVVQINPGDNYVRDGYGDVFQTIKISGSVFITNVPENLSANKVIVIDSNNQLSYIDISHISGSGGSGTNGTSGTSGTSGISGGVGSIGSKSGGF